MRRVAIVVSSPLTVRAFLQDQIEALTREYEVWVVADVASPQDLSFLPATTNIFPIPLVRSIAPIHDGTALLRLFLFFRRYRFDLVHSVTPKAGLLAMTAAFAARVPVRVHTFTGQVWATRSGWQRWSLRGIDQLYARLATFVFVDSRTQRDFLLEERVVRPERSTVLASGSISGVDTDRFAPNPTTRERVRNELGLGEDDVLFLFLGRLRRDKGVLTLAEAFRRISASRPDARLLIVGSDEEGLLANSALTSLEQTHFIGYTNTPERFMAAADVFCLPSRREGFGTSVIEAASVGVPAVASRIYGLTDAILDGETGLLHEPDNVIDLARCMQRMLENPGLRRQLAAAARDRAGREFPQERLTDALLDAYRRLLQDVERRSRYRQVPRR